MRVLVGLDDHDSPEGGCTTHFATIFVRSIIQDRNEVRLLSLPRLVRLNPAIPWKTRGNAALALEVETDDPKDLFYSLVNLTEEYDREFSKGKKYGRQPGVVVLPSSHLQSVRQFYIKGLKDVVIKGDVIAKLSKLSDTYFTLNRGVIGSVSALGFAPNEGFTYELILYRKSYIERPNLDDIIKSQEEKEFPKLFFNYDYLKNVAISVPRGPDPVLIGIRGNDTISLLSVAQELVKSSSLRDVLDGAMLFVTNQHTGVHVTDTVQPRPYRSVKVRGVVLGTEIKPGGDVFMRVDSGYEVYTTVVYKETGTLARAAQLLEIGDEIEVEAVVKPSTEYGLLLEAEAIRIVNLVDYELSNPKCPVCGGSSESLGKNKGFRCRRCGFVIKSNKVAVPKARGLTLSRYVSQRPRHLTRFDYVEVSRSEPDPKEVQDLLHKLNELFAPKAGLNFI